MSLYIGFYRHNHVPNSKPAPAPARIVEVSSQQWGLDQYDQ